MCNCFWPCTVLSFSTRVRVQVEFVRFSELHSTMGLIRNKHVQNTFETRSKHAHMHKRFSRGSAPRSLPADMAGAASPKDVMIVLRWAVRDNLSTQLSRRALLQPSEALAHKALLPRLASAMCYLFEPPKSSSL